MRFPTQEACDAMLARVHALQAVGPDTSIRIESRVTRPPYAKFDGIQKLFDHAKGLAKEIGFELGEVTQTGGGSDGNFTGAMGIPTLDGLGVDGRGAHAIDEQLYYSSLEPRAKLMLRLLETLR
jgi:glutamate carboxypeptidase